MRINNNNFQKNSNICRILETIWRCNQISRIEIARELDLYRSTVSNIINSLIKAGIIEEKTSGKAMPQGGRKPIFLSLNKNFACIIGLEIQFSKYRAIAMNLNGEILYTKKGNCDDITIAGSIKFVFDQLLPEIKQQGLPPIIGICTGLPGIIDAEQSNVILSIPFKTKNLSLLECKELDLGLPFLIENDANCLGWLQLIKNRTQQHRDFLVVLAENHNDNLKKERHLGIGVGISITCDNKVRYGTQFGAGEFVTYSWRQGNPGQTSLTADEIDNIFNSQEVYKKWAIDVFSTLAPITSIFAPDCIFVHGQTESQQALLQQIINEDVPQLKDIMNSNSCALKFEPNNEFDVASGAACMLLQKLFSVPDISEIDTKIRFDWDALFDLAKNNSLFKAPTN